MSTIQSPQMPGDEADALCVAAVAGDEASLRAFWESNRRWVAAILLAHKPAWADVDDLLQDVALALVRNIHEVREPRALKAWLRTVAINAAHLAARSGKRRRSTLRLASTGDDERTEEPLASSRDGMPAPAALGVSEEGQRLMRLAGQLPEGYREPLLLKAVHNLSYREIGRILGLPESTIETRIARGRRQLRELAERDASAGFADVGSAMPRAGSPAPAKRAGDGIAPGAHPSDQPLPELGAAKDQTYGRSTNPPV